MLGNFGKRAAWKGEYAELLRREAAARRPAGSEPGRLGKARPVFDSLLPASVFPSRLSVAASDAVGAEFAETFRALVDTGAERSETCSRRPGRRGDRSVAGGSG